MDLSKYFDDPTIIVKIPTEGLDTSGIYAIVIRNNNSSRIYIGSTKCKFYKRFYEHLYEIKKGIHTNIKLIRSFAKNKNIEFMIVEICEDISDKELRRKEDEWLNYYPKSKIMNMVPAVPNAFANGRVTQEIIKKRSDAIKKTNACKRIKKEVENAQNKIGLLLDKEKIKQQLKIIYSSEWYLPEEIATYLDVPLYVVNKLIKNGQLKAQEIGKVFFISSEELYILTGNFESIHHED